MCNFAFPNLSKVWSEEDSMRNPNNIMALIAVPTAGAASHCVFNNLLNVFLDFFEYALGAKSHFPPIINLVFIEAYRNIKDHRHWIKT